MSHCIDPYPQIGGRQYVHSRWVNAIEKAVELSTRGATQTGGLRRADAARRQAHEWKA